MTQHDLLINKKTELEPFSKRIFKYLNFADQLIPEKNYFQIDKIDLATNKPNDSASSADYKNLS